MSNRDITSSPPDRIGTRFEQICALQDIRNIVWERGNDITLIIRGEGNITRDGYNSIEQREVTKDITLRIRAYPVDYNPSERRLEKAGIKIQCECIAWLAMYDFIKRNILFDEIDITRTTVHLSGNNFEIKEKSQASMLTDQYGYITLGLNKR